MIAIAIHSTTWSVRGEQDDGESGLKMGYRVDYETETLGKTGRRSMFRMKLQLKHEAESGEKEIK